jgi:hypothetical protein
MFKLQRTKFNFASAKSKKTDKTDFSQNENEICKAKTKLEGNLQYATTTQNFESVDLLGACAM